MTILSFSTPLLPETLLELTIIRRASGTEGGGGGGGVQVHPYFLAGFFPMEECGTKQMNLDVQLQFAKNHLFCPDFFFEYLSD